MFQWCVTDVSCEQISPSSQLAYVSNFFLLHFCFDSLHCLDVFAFRLCMRRVCNMNQLQEGFHGFGQSTFVLLCLFSLTFIQIHLIKCNEKIFCSLEYGISLKTILAIIIIIRRRTKYWILNWLKYSQCVQTKLTIQEIKRVIFQQWAESINHLLNQMIQLTDQLQISFSSYSFCMYPCIIIAIKLTWAMLTLQACSYISDLRIWLS